MELNRTQGIVKEKLSSSSYLVELDDGREVCLRLQGRHVLNYLQLSVGLTVHLQLVPPDEKRGLLLTATDFKINGWNGGPNPDDY